MDSCGRFIYGSFAADEYYPKGVYDFMNFIDLINL